MRILITGVDAQGRSCVVEETSPSVPHESGRASVIVAAETESSPPPPRPPGHGDLLPIIRTPGLVRWSFVEFPARLATPLHHTDSVDFDVVLEGSVDLILDDGAHRLRPGDGVVVNGVDHSWETHEEACRMSVVVIATPPLE